MNRIIKGVMAFALLVPPVYGGDCHVVRKQVVVQNEVALVPFVAPLGVVIPGSPFYSYRGAAQSYQQPQPQAASVDPDYAEFLEWKAAKANTVKAQALPQTLVQQNCVKCHTEKPDARAALDMSKPLDAEGKLAAIKALVEGSMPKGKAIDTAARGNLIGELTGAATAPK